MEGGQFLPADHRALQFLGHGAAPHDVPEVDNLALAGVYKISAPSAGDCGRSSPSTLAKRLQAKQLNLIPGARPKDDIVALFV
jgi:hypothetical protein